MLILTVIHLALFEPEIPPNTGNIIRLCANTSTQLHIIEPMGFDWCDKRLRRAGLDYNEFATVKRYEDWNTFKKEQGKKKMVALTTKGHQSFFEIDFKKNANESEIMIILGPETRGLPATILTELGSENCLRIPMASSSRSLNLSNTAAICVYEAWRQLGFQSLK